MKKIVLVLFSIACIISVSCKKNNNGSNNDGPGEVYGKWKLTEVMQDPGNGSIGKYQKVSGQPKYLTLEKSGKFEGDAIPELLTYKILDSVQMEVTNKNYNKTLIYGYKVSAKSLQINPPCFEGCGYRFVRE
ncbi:hypothetical protein FFJ24_004925 [Pedobacter sp. KBS0701]|uniref:hypothetical protein n=1 Tax=Pedobacter sp. KBS0701 TaxID=2578106 RepID=UPI00110E848D|nr:hypothetical protein [Pedobacter sp. KBS0701]QDW24197.1 hypothetical protein FFJ24_004925 [Pedobacter sp. KBS0701]